MLLNDIGLPKNIVAAVETFDQEKKEWRWYDAWQRAVIEHLSSAAVPEKPKLT